MTPDQIKLLGISLGWSAIAFYLVTLVLLYIAGRQKKYPNGYEFSARISIIMSGIVLITSMWLLN